MIESLLKFLIILLLCRGVAANCDIPEIPRKNWINDFYYNDMEIGSDYNGILKEFQTKNVIGVDIEKGVFSRYVKVKQTGSRFQISTSPEFKNYARDQNNLEFFVILKFSCKNGQTKDLEFIQKVRMVDQNCQGKRTPTFEKPLYQGTFYGNHSIDLENIILLKETYNDRVRFSLEGEYSDYFQIISRKNYLKISLARFKTLPLKLLESSYISFIITAQQDEISTGKTVVIFNINSNEQKAPKFEHEMYGGIWYLEENHLEIDDIFLVEETYTEDIDIEFWQTREIFECFYRGNQVFIREPDVAYTYDDFDVTHIVFVLKAIKSNGMMGTVSGLVKIVGPQESTATDTVFWTPDNETVYELVDDNEDEYDDYEDDENDGDLE